MNPDDNTQTPRDAVRRDREQAVFEAAATLLLLVDASGIVTDVNPAARETLWQAGAPFDGPVGRPVWEVLQFHGRQDPQRNPIVTKEWFEGLLLQDECKVDNVLVSGVSGASFHADCKAVSFVEPGEGPGVVIGLTDHSERNQALARLNWRDHHDPLTDLPNRALLLVRLQAVLESGRAERHAVVSIDLDRFASINQMLGRRRADHILLQVAERITSAANIGATVARVGGIQFAVMLEDVGDAARAVQIAEKMRAALAEPFADEVAGSSGIRFSASLGVVLVDELADSAEDLVRDAEAAAAQARSRGGNRVEVYDAQLRDRTTRRLTLAATIRGALTRGEMSVLYQPIVRVESGLLVGFEALMHWDHPTEGPIPATTFMPIAHDTGVSAELDEWILDVACADAAKWQRARGTTLGLHINLSSRQMASDTLTNTVADVMTRHGLPPTALTVEVHESTLLEEPDRATQRLNSLAAIGVPLAIDDFGAGYSSLAYLRQFPLRMVKIARTFVSGLAQSSHDQRIVHAIVDLSHGLGFEVVAEGVETDAELSALQEMGCDMAQGWLFGHPLAPAEALVVAASATASSF